MTRIVLVGGGTAGYTSPLITTTQALVESDPDVEITYIGTSKGFETRVIPQVGFKLELIRPILMPRKSSLDLVRSSRNLRQSVCQARTILSWAKAQAPIDFGGYVAILAYLAACTMRAPVLTHEANSVVGITNKMAARFTAPTGYTSPDTQTREGKRIRMPANHSIIRPGITRVEIRKHFGLDPERPTLLVSGGSQGARTINQALSIAVSAILNVGIQVPYVSGAKDFTDADVVTESGNGARYTPMTYIGAVVEAHVVADLVIGRARAGTTMGTAVSGLPVTSIPLPWDNGEQTQNAAGLVMNRVGILPPEAELSVGELSDPMIPTIANAEKLARMAGLARPHSPADVVDAPAGTTINVIQGEEVS